MKKILVLSHASELVGGAERSIVEVMAVLEKKYDVQPEFILREPVESLGPEIKKRGWKYHSLPYGFWSESSPPKTTEARYKKALQNTQAILGIEEIIKESKPDMVLTNSIVCPWAAFAAYYQGVPHVWFVREYGDLDHGRVFDMTQRQIFEDVDTLSSLVVANSQALTKHIAQYISSDKLTTLYHPFDVDGMRQLGEVRVNTPFVSPPSLRLVLPAGSVTASKGFLEAVVATGILNKRGHDTELCLIGKTGDKNFTAELSKVIEQYDIKDKVHFVGFKKNPMPYIALADVGIMASRMEAFGRVTFEYMVFGKPVVGVGAGGTSEMVKSGENGFLYDYRDTDGLVAALENYAKNRQLLDKHGKNSLKRVNDMLSGKHNIDELYEKMISSIKTPNTQIRPLNYTHEWLGYPALANDYLETAGVGSVKRLLIKNSKIRAKDTARKVRAAYRRKKS